MACAHFGLIPAAGSSLRFGDPLPKQYQRLCGRTLLEHAVRSLACAALIRTIYVVLAPGDEHYRTCAFEGVGAQVVALHCGGSTRAASVFNGLMAVRNEVDDGDWLLVHDAARPCLSEQELARLLADVDDDEVGGLLALPVTDTLKRAGDDGRSSATVSRVDLWRAATPQMFRYRLLVEALRRADRALATDEASAIESLGLRPRLVHGASTNIKVTYPEDLMIARAILDARGRAA
jgi:2-C-methyl-D-erythritol 4-phosphate cytidylyltransferase